LEWLQHLFEGTLVNHEESQTSDHPAEQIAVWAVTLLLGPARFIRIVQWYLSGWLADGEVFAVLFVGS
jgi:hypothetical protein